MAEAGSVRAGDRWQGMLRAARIEAAVTNIGTAVLTGATGIAAIICFVGEARGWLNPGTWTIVLAGGATVTLCKAVFDFRDRSNESALWRAVLIREFGDEMRRDGEVARLARLAIEFRVRLSAAEAKARPSLSAKLAVLVPRVDDWLDLIVGLARKVASLRGEARFQAGLAKIAKERLHQLEVQTRLATDPAQARQFAETGRALSAQVQAFEGFNRYVEEGCLRLEHAVGAFTAACSELALELSRQETGTAPQKIAIQIGNEMAATEQVLAAIGQLAAPSFPEVIEVVDVSRTP